jgi:hypothetical protein
VAVHEAGHAVGRFLTAEQLGVPYEDAIMYIEVDAVPVSQRHKTFDKAVDVHSQAVTFGPMFSKPLQEFIKEKSSAFAREGDVELSLEELTAMMRDARAAGLDVDKSFRAKTLSNILGPMAEATLLAKPFEEVWNDYAAVEDRTNVAKEGILAGLTPQEIEAAVEEVTSCASQEIGRPEVWRAILAVADSLRRGCNPGRKIAAIITRELNL